MSLLKHFSVYLPNSTAQNDFCRVYQTGDKVIVYKTPYETQGSNVVASPTAFTNLGTAIISTITQLNDDPNNHPGYPANGDGSSVYPQARSSPGCRAMQPRLQRVLM